MEKNATLSLMLMMALLIGVPAQVFADFTAPRGGRVTVLQKSETAQSVSEDADYSNWIMPGLITAGVTVVSTAFIVMYMKIRKLQHINAGLRADNSELGDYFGMATELISEMIDE